MRNLIVVSLSVALLSWAATNITTVIADSMIIFGPSLSCDGLLEEGSYEL